jgi:lipoprotein-releasing system ATP-binding protein
MSVITAKEIFKSFQGKNEKIEVLKGVNFSAEEGEVIVVYGASGAGKSTLLHILGILDLPDSGEITVCGVNPVDSTGSEINEIRNKSFGFVFQFHHLLPEFSAIENVIMPALVGGKIRNNVTGRAKELLNEVGLSHRYFHRPAELSGGEQQRVAVARALMNDPAIIMADEPSGNLDEENSELLHSLIFRLSKSKKQTFIIVTHKKELMDKADRCLILKEGILIEGE